MARNCPPPTTIIIFIQNTKMPVRFARRMRKPMSKKRYTRKAVARSLTPLQKKEVRLITAAPIETKYSAIVLTAVSSVLPTLTSVGSGWAAGGLSYLLPPVTQGAQQNERVGLRIKPTALRVHCRAWFAPPSAGLYPTQDISVKFFFLSSKRIKSWAQAGSLPPNNLIDNGNQSQNDWSNPVYPQPLIYDMQRVSQDDFVVNKIHTLRLVKNQGTGNSDAAPGQVPNVGILGMKSFVHTMKLPALQYEGVLDQQPSNVCPLLGVVGFNNDTTAFVTGSVVFSVYTELIYKDA